MTAGRFHSVPLMFALLAVSPPAAAADLFEPTGFDQPRAVVVADFNDDGVPDMAVAHSASNQVAILLGDGSGGFLPSDFSPVSVTTRPTGLAAAELDPTAGSDLLVVQNRAGTLSVFTGDPILDPSGFLQVRFQLDSSFVVGISPVSVVVGHFNDDDGDGTPGSAGDFIDAAVTLSAQDEVTVLAGLADGNFDVEANYPTDDPLNIQPVFRPLGPEFIVAGDFDQDGDIDLLVTNSAGAGATTNGVPENKSLALLLGNNDRTFQDPIFIDSCSRCAVPGGIAVDNFNQDLDPVSNRPVLDLAVSFAGGFCTGPIACTGDGDCAAPQTCNFGFCSDTPPPICTADADCDSVETCRRFDRVAVFPGDPGETDRFGPPQELVQPPGSSPAGILAANLDGDAAIDLAVANNGDDTVTVYLNDGSGGFPTPGATVLPAPAPALTNAHEYNRPIALAPIFTGPPGTPVDLFVVHFDTDNASRLRNQSTPGTADFLVDAAVTTSGLLDPVDLTAGAFFSTISDDLFATWNAPAARHGLILQEFGPETLPRTGAFGFVCSGDFQTPCDPDADCSAVGGFCTSDGVCSGDNQTFCNPNVDCGGAGGVCSREVTSVVPVADEIGRAATADFNGDSLTDVALAARDGSTGTPGVLVLLRSFEFDIDGNPRIILRQDGFLATGGPGEQLPGAIALDDLNPLDNDFDLIPDNLDNCPSTFNPVSDCDADPLTPDAQCDSDMNGTGDACEDDADPDPCGDSPGSPDCDADGINNSSDNCPAIANPLQDDFDGNGIGDLCERAGVVDIIAVSDADANGQGEINIFPGRGDGTFCTDPAGEVDCLPRTSCPPWPAPLPANSLCTYLFPDSPSSGVTGEFNVFDVDFDTVQDVLDNCPTVPNPSQVNTEALCFGGSNDGGCCLTGTDCPGGSCEEPGACSAGSSTPNAPCRTSTNGLCVPEDLDAGSVCLQDSDCSATAHCDVSSAVECFQLGVQDVCPAGEICLGDGDGSCGDCSGGTCLGRFRGDACSSCTVDSDGDTIVDGEDNCPADPIPLQADTDNDGIGDVCEIQGTDLVAGTDAGMTMFTGDSKGRLFHPDRVAIGLNPGDPPIQSVSGLATGLIEGQFGFGVVAVENSAVPQTVRVLQTDAIGTLFQTGVLDLSDPAILDPAIPQAQFADLFLGDLNQDGSDDVFLAETTAGSCAVGSPGEGGRCDDDGDCGGGAGSCLPTGALVAALGTVADLCLGGSDPGTPCTASSDCPGGTCGQSQLFLAPGAPFFSGITPAALGVTQFTDDNGDGLVSSVDDPDIAVALVGTQNLLILANRLQQRSDIDRSGRVDGFDLADLARDFGRVYDRTAVPIPDSDLNLDGEVDGRDLAILTNLFGRNF